MSEDTILSAKEVSKLIGTNQSTLSNWRQLENPPLKHSVNAAGRVYYTADAIAEYLSESKRHQPLLDAYVAAINATIPNI